MNDTSKNWKQRLQDYETTPDKEVWEGVSRSVRRVARRRAAYGVAAATLVLGGLVAGVLLSPKGEADSLPSSAEPAAVAAAAAPVVAPMPADVAQPATADAALEQPSSRSVADAVVEPAMPLSETFVPSAPSAEVAERQLPVETAPVALPAEPDATQVGTVQPAQDDVEAADEAEASLPADEAHDASPVAATKPTTAPDSLVVWIPNAFSPEDPSNDEVCTFRVIPNRDAVISNYTIHIYSRAGRLVFRSENVNEAWDGTCNGVRQPTGSYVYVIGYRDAHYGIQHARGTVTLLR